MLINVQLIISFILVFFFIEKCSGMENELKKAAKKLDSILSKERKEKAGKGGESGLDGQSEMAKSLLEREKGSIRDTEKGKGTLTPSLLGSDEGGKGKLAPSLLDTEKGKGKLAPSDGMGQGKFTSSLLEITQVDENMATSQSESMGTVVRKGAELAPSLFDKPKKRGMASSLLDNEEEKGVAPSLLDTREKKGIAKSLLDTKEGMAKSLLDSDEQGKIKLVPIDERDTNYLNENEYKQNPENDNDFDQMVKAAILKLKEEKTTLTQMFISLGRALEGIKKRRIRFVRLIGPGSLRFHLNHYNFDDAKEDREKFDKYPREVRENMAKMFQIRAAYQIALLLLTKHHLQRQNGTHPIEAFVEELGLAQIEIDYLRRRGIGHIQGQRPGQGKMENIENIPSEVSQMDMDAEATLVLMFSCPFDMTYHLIKAYEKSGKIKNLILVESMIAYGGTNPEHRQMCLTPFNRIDINNSIKPFQETRMAKDLFRQESTRIYYYNFV